MKLVKNFNHKNIVKYFDLEHEHEMTFLTMEYVSGGNLYEFIQTKFTLACYWTIISQILTDVARAMVYLHNQKIVQGDLKSHNILLRYGTYQGVICDIGISRSVENVDESKKRNQTAKGILSFLFCALLCF